MHTLKILFLCIFISLLSVSLCVSTPINSNSKYTQEELSRWIQKLPPVIKELPEEYHEPFASLFTDIEGYIHNHPIPKVEDDEKYLSDVADILQEYALQSLPFMLNLRAKITQDPNKNLYLIMEILCDPSMTNGYYVLTLYWQITKIKNKEF